MRILSLLQPWASLVLMGHKTWETRSYRTRFQEQDIAIASSARLLPAHRELCRHFPFNGYITEPGNLPLGRILCVVRLGKIITSTEWVMQNIDKPEMMTFEHKFGNYNPGRFAWPMTNLRKLGTLLPVKGKQCIWESGPELEARIREHLQAA